ncbi:hypothetical protein RIF29_20679 [Crotalaria pallida]|uniref:Uncharacterized protein n=1 Tax=Crotalaria pallida TaxID=3830 RepID=A0AAN9I6J7_CROPI
MHTSEGTRIVETRIVVMRIVVTWIVVIVREAIRKVDWNVKGQPTGKYKAMFRSHIDLIVRQETTWDIDEKHRSYVLKAVGDSLETFKVRLNRWRKKIGANHPPKQYADAITLEEWEEFVQHCTTENFVLKEMASKEASLPRYALYMVARLNKKGEVDNENARQIVEEIVSLT